RGVGIGKARRAGPRESAVRPGRSGRPRRIEVDTVATRATRARRALSTADHLGARTRRSALSTTSPVAGWLHGQVKHGGRARLRRAAAAGGVLASGAGLPDAG